MDADCKGLFGNLRCQFQPRYDISEPIIPGNLTHIQRFDANDWKKKTYVCDVCTRCGKQTIRPEKA